MAYTIRSARITGKVSYLGDEGRHRNIPLGPCLVEQEDGQPAHIVWGGKAQNSAALPVQQLAQAQQSGHIVLLD